jgi:hypothetical protein
VRRFLEGAAFLLVMGAIVFDLWRRGGFTPHVLVILGIAGAAAFIREAWRALNPRRPANDR